MVGLALGEEVGESGPRGAETGGDFVELPLQSLLLGLPGGGSRRVGKPAQSLGQGTLRHGLGEVGGAVGAHAAFPPLTEGAGAGELLEEAVDLGKEVGRGGDRLVVPRLLEEPLAGARIVETLDRLTQTVLGERKTKVTRGDLLDGVRLVEDHEVIGEEIAYPLLLGHETVGRVVEKGAKVRSFAVGDRVLGGLVISPTGFGSGWGGDSEYVLAADHKAMVADGVADAAHGWFETCEIMLKVPEDIPLEAAGLLATWREVYGGFSDFRLGKGDDILIFGAGPVGLSFCRFAKLLGLGWVGVVDTLPFKRDKALAMGADAVFAPDDHAITALAATRGKALDAVVESSRRIVAEIDPTLVKAIGFSGQMMGCVCVDARGMPLRPAILYCDQRGTAEEERILSKIGALEFYRITGHRASASYSAAKLMWVKEHEPEIYAKTAKMLHAKDFVNFRLTGVMRSEYSDASGTNLLDLRALEWSQRLVGISGLDGDKLPELVPSTAVIGELTSAAARELTGTVRSTTWPYSARARRCIWPPDRVMW